MNKLFLVLLLITFGLGSRAQDIFNAARQNDTTALAQMISNSVRIDTTDNRGSTPLIIAVYNDNEAATRLLLAKGANPNARDFSGNTALMGACFKGLLNMVTDLYQYKTAVNQVNYNGATALIFAATFGHEDITRILLKYGADKAIKDKFGKTALDYAINQENKNIIDILKD
ncbi:ankyrin repeat domain-containing protein [Pedobacter cryoconitis]|uniref:Ankyrin n=1 Tax=Pedobacter cryoconitis TaxID=188932 RepID=A0A7X0MH64_9SPHI|nr:ankyrin repeat domain-containing protein [Pedobacter cryoconitis]MBB6498814.1 hypothetical protein [Pedobacter cryoconitis]